jgi:membrane protein implicated in regulation of membrane protease activity
VACAAYSLLSREEVFFMNWEIATWLIIFAVCLIAEMISLGLTTIWFCGGALVALIIALFGGPIPLQIIVFLIVSLVLLFTTRPIARKHFDNKRTKTNVESLVGTHVIVTSTIDNLKFTGQVTIGGIEWTARSKNGDVIEEGAEVVIEEIAGVKAIVSKV